MCIVIESRLLAGVEGGCGWCVVYLLLRSPPAWICVAAAGNIFKMRV